jgi:hypothetical protein
VRNFLTPSAGGDVRNFLTSFGPAPGELECDAHSSAMNDQNDAEDTDAAVTVAIPVTTESATEATKQEDDEK